MRIHRLLLVVACSPFLLIGTAIAVEDPAPLRLVDGTREAAKPRELTPRNGIWDLTGAGPASGAPRIRSVPSPECVVWGADADWPGRGGVFLSDGSVLAGELVRLEQESLDIQTPAFGLVSVSRTLVTGVLVRPPADPMTCDRLVNRLGARAGEFAASPSPPRSRGATSGSAAESVELLNGDLLAGEIRGAPIPQGGGLDALLVGEPPGLFRLEQVVAIRLNAHVPEPVGGQRRFWLGLKDGSRLAVSGWEGTTASERLVLSCGVALGFADKDWTNRLVSFRPLETPVTFLSDLPSVGYKHIPFLAGDWQLGIDGSSRGGALRHRGKLVAKGLGMHATSRVAFDLPPGNWFLDGELAVDDSSGTRGSVVFRVYRQGVAGEAGNWRPLYESPVVRGGDAAIPLRVDLRGAARLALVVDAADRGDEGDDANWLWLRLTPAGPKP